MKAPFWCLPDYADLCGMLLCPLATPKINFDACAGLVIVSTIGQLSSDYGSAGDFGKVQIMGLRAGMPNPGPVCDIPFALVVVEVPPSWTCDMHNLIEQQLVKGVPVVVVGEAVDVKPVVRGLRNIVQEESTVINLLLYNTSCKIRRYIMAEKMMCILSHDAILGPKLHWYLSYVEATWFGTLPIEVVGYFFSRFIAEECD